jgi:tetratricopeptide (TPR) repeat protein
LGTNLKNSSCQKKAVIFFYVHKGTADLVPIMASVDIDRNTIEVHVHGNEYVDIQVAPLPAASEILAVLTEETDMKYFIRLAIQYRKEKRFEEETQFLEQCDDPGTRRCDREQTKQAILVIKANQKLIELHNIKLIHQPGQRRKLLEEAQHLLAEAERIQPGYLVVWILRGIIYLERENYEQAELQFGNVLSKWKDNLAALTGMALSFMKRSEWRKALRFWQLTLRVISSDVHIPLDVQCLVRLGIGNCFAKLNLLKEARVAFTRVLELDPSNPTALSYLSSLCLNEMRRPECSQGDRRQLHHMGVNYAQQAFKAMKEKQIDDPLVLTRLADLLFLEGRYDEVPRMVEKAKEATLDPAILSELHYFMGRHYHRLNDFDQAFAEYSRSLTLGGLGLVLPRFPLAQIHAHRAEVSQAIEHLDAIRERVRGRSKTKVPLNPDGTSSLATGVGTALGDDYDTLRLLAFLHARLAENPIQASATMPTREYEEARERGRQLYARALDLFRTLYTFRSPDIDESGARDFHALIMHARLLETSPTATPEMRKSALELYQRAEARCIKDQLSTLMFPELINNIGVLHHLAGNAPSAKTNYLRSFELIRENSCVVHKIFL